MTMPDETAAARAPERAGPSPVAPPTGPPTAAPQRAHTRVRHGMKKPHNWVQLGKFVAVGGSGYAVNLIVFSIVYGLLDLHHLIAATAAFVVAVFNNFWWNRHWTFGARDGHAGFQAARFFAVSTLAFLFALAILELLVRNTGLPEVVAQAISLVAATPLNFIGNKMWSFGRSIPPRV
jgi:dolichol-phosphate mannosyltransferase